MKLTVQSPEAPHWFNLVVEALVALEQEVDAYKERSRVTAITRRNKSVRFVPFVKPWPQDKEVDLIKFYDEALFPSKYEWRLYRFKEHEESLEEVFRALDTLNSGNLHAVELSNQELNLIRRYANASTDSK